MNTVINYDSNYGLRVTGDNEILAAVVHSLARNNTFVPNITKVQSLNRKGKDVLVVSFSDDTWVEVTRNEADSNDPTMAFLYALAKRIFGKPTSGGYVEGDGFMARIKDLVGSIKTEKDLENEKAARIKAKEEADRKAHEEAVIRHSKNPSIGYRLRSLEDKFDRLMEVLGGEGSVKSKEVKNDQPSKRDKKGRFCRFFNK